ncbi:MAG: mltB [Hyphomicrobiales bacterium]|nr:mltB [Hyphomicrobiales bacterium]
MRSSSYTDLPRASPAFDATGRNFHPSTLYFPPPHRRACQRPLFVARLGKAKRGARVVRFTNFKMILWAVAGVMLLAPNARAAQCGNASAGFEAWKQEFAAEARGAGMSGQAVAALLSTTYATRTISADRGQKSFHLTLDEFLKKRGASVIVSRGRKLKRTHAALFRSIEERYGVPPGPLLAIWGMETGFGATLGDQKALSSVATLAFDCRRSAFFTDQLMAALKLVDRGILSPNSRGSMHGEIGHTQFLPKNILLYGTGGSLEDPAVALASTANFLKGHGWKAGQGYQPGEPDFAAIQAWNAATVYQRALAQMGRQIDLGDSASQ